jgi:hypothetical protein
MSRIVASAALAAGLTLLVSSASAAEPEIAGKYAFPFIKAKKTKCAKVAGKLLKTLQKDFSCAVPEEGTASGVKFVAKCTAKKGSEIYGVFETAKDCAKERETQIANAEGA